MMARKVLFLIALCVFVDWSSAECNNDVAEADGAGGCKCKDGSSVYDYLNDICEDASDFYKYGGCGPYSKKNRVPCECGDAFVLNTTTRECDDVNSCGTTTCAATVEECRNRIGDEYCKCEEFYYRKTSLCSYLDESLNPKWHNCTQKAIDKTSGFRCNCVNSNMFILAADGVTCDIQNGYSDCEGHDDDGARCVEDTNTKEKSYFALPGFKLDANNKSLDIDECTEMPNNYCWQNSECVNLANGQGYDCKCLPGFTDALFADDTIKECIPMMCGRGQNEDCLNACDNEVCDTNKFCLVQDNSTVCVEALLNTIVDKDQPWNIFTSFISIWNLEESLGQVTESLEMVFGENNVQLQASTSSAQQFDLTVMLETASVSVPSDRLISYCHGLENLQGYCELPGGIIIQSVPFSFEKQAVCQISNPCPEEATCDESTRTCLCKDGHAISFFPDTDETCSGATGVQKIMEGAALNAMLALTILALARCYF